MSATSFYGRIKSALEDKELKTAVTKATNTTLEKRQLISEQTKNWEDLRQWASDIKSDTLNHLNEYLLSAEKKLKDGGCFVEWAETGSEANEIVLNIFKKRGIKSVVKAKSMVSEEIHLNDFLIKNGIVVYETDLGEHIVQIAGETPSHITAPALHKSKKQIAELFQKVHNIPYTENAEDLTECARGYLRDKFFKADAGISGCNFLCADTGTMVIVENEGNIRFSTTTPEIHIAIIGIEKLIPKFEYVGNFIRLLAPSATGQIFPTYVSFLSPSQRNTEKPKEIHVIFLDNGRTRILNSPEFTTALQCIRCGACMNSCPIYRRTGGHAYSTIYPGPIGSIISQFIGEEKNITDLVFGSSLCGACSEVCPVKINLHELILEMRNFKNSKSSRFMEKRFIKVLNSTLIKPDFYNLFSKSMRLSDKIFKLRRLLKGWNKKRILPDLSRERFSTTFRKIYGKQR